MKHLVIVESPTKARTIGRYLGDDYTIKFSMGHVMDLPKSKLGVDIQNDFKPQLQMVADKKPIVTELQKLSKKADMVILATDPDREGEAIAANIRELLKDKGNAGKFKRIVFHEITKEAIEEAVKHPRSVDEHLVDAQTARRVLDRLVGYQISPILWQKVRRGLSAGRVQSVALRLIVEREREIEKFTKEPYFTIHGTFTKRSKGTKETKGPEVVFDLTLINDKRIDEQRIFKLYDGEYKISKTTITKEELAKELTEDIKKQSYVVTDVNQKELRRSPFPPHTTSSLQQDAARRFGYPGKRTMSLAQKLYEEGFITYHRTDSVVIAASAINAFRTYIKTTYGEKYLPESPRMYATKQKAAQEAHEGIRPTNIKRTVEDVRKELGNDYAKMYDLIWRRSLGSQMADAIIESTSVVAKTQSKSAKGNIYTFRTNGSVLKFDGFLRINPQALQDKKLPQYTVDETLIPKEISDEPHQTPPPPRYNDASLIQALEEKEIGRPSTYASIISTLTDRAYVERVERRFEPTHVGKAVNDFLVENFSAIDDIPFTAQMETDLDEVANGKKEWVKMMREFYQPFSKSIDAVKEGAKRVKIETEQTDEECPECHQSNLVVRTGRFGKFLSCGRFPDCKFTKPFVEKTKIKCPKDNGDVIIKKTRKGRKFYGCSNYPNCDFAAWKLEDIKGISKKSLSAEKERTEEKENPQVTAEA